MKTTTAKLIMGLTLLTGLILIMSFKTVIQAKVFTAPASADAVANPVKGNADATAAGKKLYDANCSICHGMKGQGDGVAAAGLAKPPANHTSAAVQKLSDGALFWMITEGNAPMPSYKTTYSETQRWQLVNYIRTLAKPIKK
jgi:mono/diheme cytochrome c family protein